AFDVLANHVARGVVERGEIVKRGNVRMTDSRCEARFAQKTIVRTLIAGDVRPHHLDDADGVQVNVQRLVHLAHSADAEPRQNLVLAVDGSLEIFAEKIGDSLAAVRAGFIARIDFRSAVDAEEGHGGWASVSAIIRCTGAGTDIYGAHGGPGRNPPHNS